jgi:hypothetical protein
MNKNKAFPLLLLGVVLLLASSLAACTPAQTPAPTPPVVEPEHTPSPSPAPTPTPTPSREITLADAPPILDMSTDLPAGFEHIDAATESLSNEDLGLGPTCSEVELFLCEQPYTIVYAYLIITESRIERVQMDNLLEDDEMRKSYLLYWIEMGFVEEGGEMPDVDLNITHPDIGRPASMGSAQMTAYGMSYEFSTLAFRDNGVYVDMYQISTRNGLSLVTLANGIIQRMGALREA